LKNDRDYQHICKHIAKASRANADTNASSKSLQSQRRKKNCLKKSPTFKKIKTLANKPTQTDKKAK